MTSLLCYPLAHHQDKLLAFENNKQQVVVILCAILAWARQPAILPVFPTPTPPINTTTWLHIVFARCADYGHTQQAVHAVSINATPRVRDMDLLHGESPSFRHEMSGV